MIYTDVFIRKSSSCIVIEIGIGFYIWIGLHMNWFLHIGFRYWILSRKFVVKILPGEIKALVFKLWISGEFSIHCTNIWFFHFVHFSNSFLKHPILKFAWMQQFTSYFVLQLFLAFSFPAMASCAFGNFGSFVIWRLSTACFCEITAWHD